MKKTVMDWQQCGALLLHWPVPTQNKIHRYIYTDHCRRQDILTVKHLADNYKTLD